MIKLLTWNLAVSIRKGVQLLFFAFFIVLLFMQVENRQAPPLADLFFRLNPLSALSVTLATRSWVPGLEWALLTVGLTLLFGRVWCGWVCPMGTLLEWIRLPRSNRRRAARPGRAAAQAEAGAPYEPMAGLRAIKTLGLVALLTSAALGSLALAALDPIAILTRSMTTSILPAFHHAVNTVESALYSLPILRPLVDGLESALRGRILPALPPVFAQNQLIAILFLGVLALNLLAPRFWCRYLCPLGALLGWLSKIALFRPLVGASCNRCTRCAIVCDPAAVDASGEKARILPSECTVCLDCLASCKKDDIRFGTLLSSRRFRDTPSSSHTEYTKQPARIISGNLREDPSTTLTRREFLASMGAGALGVLLLRTDLHSRRRDSRLIRPPGAQEEAAFLSTCLRCSQCMKICPTSALQPAAFESGLEGLWTPVIIPRVGYCDYGCHACGQVCPSGAIPELSLERKREAVIGKASILRDRCLPWASATPCIVCEEMCPTPQKSIRLEEAVVPGPDEQPITVQRPSVIRDLCIGCGICENHCPLEGEAGIRVYGV